MESFPGAFPHSGSGEENALLSPEVINIQKSLKLKRKAFKKDFLYQIQCIWLIFSIICYLYDCSLLLLVLRFVTEVSLANYRLLSKHLDSNVLVFSIIGQGLTAALIHINRDLPKPNDDGYIYGHHVIQIIGEKQLPSKYLLLLFDVLLLYIQMLNFSSVYKTRKDYKTIESSAIDQEFDGLQGRTICVRSDFLKSFKPRWLSINELHEIQQQEEREDENQDTNALARLLGSSLEDYGTIPTT